MRGLDHKLTHALGSSQNRHFAKGLLAERRGHLVVAWLGAGFHVFVCIEMGNLGKYYERPRSEAIKLSPLRHHCSVARGNCQTLSSG